MIKIFEKFVNIFYPKIQISKGYILLTNENGEKIGQAQLSKISEHVAELVGMNIFINHQGRGYFPIIMNKIFDWCEENEISKLILNVGYENEKAINLYKSFGFIASEEKSKLGNDFLVMNKIF